MPEMTFEMTCTRNLACGCTETCDMSGSLVAFVPCALCQWAMHYNLMDHNLRQIAHMLDKGYADEAICYEVDISLTVLAEFVALTTPKPVVVAVLNDTDIPF